MVVKKYELIRLFTHLFLSETEINAMVIICHLIHSSRDLFLVYLSTSFFFFSCPQIISLDDIWCVLQFSLNRKKNTVREKWGKWNGWFFDRIRRCASFCTPVSFPSQEQTIMLKSDMYLHIILFSTCQVENLVDEHMYFTCGRIFFVINILSIGDIIPEPRDARTDTHTAHIKLSGDCSQLTANAWIYFGPCVIHARFFCADQSIW